MDKIKITVWKTEDGKIFQDREEAKKHEVKITEEREEQEKIKVCALIIKRLGLDSCHYNNVFITKNIIQNFEELKNLFNMKGCDDCGSYDAEETCCPYDGDVHGKETPAFLCSECEHKRAMGI